MAAGPDIKYLAQSLDRQGGLFLSLVYALVPLNYIHTVHNTKKIILDE